MERTAQGSPDVATAAERLRSPRVRAGLLAKRVLDVVISSVALVALAPVWLVCLVLLLAGPPRTRLERRVRLGRDGRRVVLVRLGPLAGGWLGRALDRIGAREIPLLVAVVGGRLSLVGPRLLPPGEEAGHTGPRRLLAPGLTGLAQQRATSPRTAARLDDLYVERWSFGRDAALLLAAGRRRAP